MKASKSRKRTRRIVRNALLVVLAGVFLFSAYQVYKIYADYHAGEQAYIALEKYIRLPAKPAVLPEDETGTSPAPQPAYYSVVFPEVDFAGLRELNPDVVAWIYCGDTTVSYPVVKAGDNDYYLRRMLDGSYNRAGTIFLDYRSAADFSDGHSVVYGHHMRNDTMFSALAGYEEQAFYDAHPYLLLMTPEKNFVIEVFSAYVASEADDAWRLGFASETELLDWANAAAERSCVTSAVRPAAGDRFITLSTCSYEYDGARFVVHGILREVP